MRSKYVGDSAEIIDKTMPENLYPIFLSPTMKSNNIPVTWNEVSELKKDIDRTSIVDFFNKEDVEKHYLEAWETNKELAPYYVQGKLDGADIASIFLWGSPDIDFEKRANDRTQPPLQLNYLRFAYVNQHGVLCGFTLGYDEDDPKKWVLCHVEKTNSLLRESQPTIYASIRPPKPDSKPDATLTDAQVSQELEGLIDCPQVKQLIRLIFDKKEVNVSYIKQLNQKLRESKNNHYDTQNLLAFIKLFSAEQVNTIQKTTDIKNELKEKKEELDQTGVTNKQTPGL